MRAREIQPRKLVIFDIDDTLVHTQTKVHVVKDGRVVKSLNSHDFTHYKLQPDEEFDFGDFRDAREFFDNAKPIIPMINQLKHDINTGNTVIMVTARADFNDRELFLDTFRKYGIDMDKVHVHRAGNLVGKFSTEEKKKIIIRDQLKKTHFTKAIMYDDAEPNLHAFVSLKNEFPHTKFYAWHVSLDGDASEYHRTDEGAFGNLVWKGQQQSTPSKQHVEPRNSLQDLGSEHGSGKELRAAEYSPRDLQRQRETEYWRKKDMADRMAWHHDDGEQDWQGETVDPISGHGINVPKSNIKQTTNTHVTRKDPAVKVDIQQRQPDPHAYTYSKPSENFADGKGPGRPGDSQRHGIPKGATMAELEKASHSKGRKGQLARWQLNMRRGHKK
jgi:FMN phosphatase YigB (HAD superfamily)